MSLDAAKNFAVSEVSTGYDAAATSIVLATGGGAKMPTAPFNATWWNSEDYPDPSDDPNVEIVRVTNVSTDTLTITRAQESTSASTKNAAGKTYKLAAGVTAKLLTDIASDISARAAASHTHAQSDVTDLVTALSGKAASSHTHAQADVTNLTTDLGILKGRIFLGI